MGLRLIDRRLVAIDRIGPVDSMRANPLASLQVIEYENPSVDAGIQLVTAVHGLAAQQRPLPSPLPDEPPVPFAYLMRLSSTLAEQDLDPRQQTHLVTELKSGLEEDGDDPTARNDIARLLRMLRDRSDVTYRTRTEIDELLASVESKAPTGAASAQPDKCNANRGEATSGFHAGQPIGRPDARTSAAPPHSAGYSSSRWRRAVSAAGQVDLVAPP